MMRYHRWLPHWYPLGEALFLTWCLKDSLPPSRRFPPRSLTSGRAFAAIDRLLEETRSGSRWLACPEIARLVVEGIRNGDVSRGHYRLHAFVVMPNHAHLLVTPLVPVPRPLQSRKGATAR